VQNPAAVPFDFEFVSNLTSAVDFSYDVRVQDARYDRTVRFNLTFVPDTDADGDGLLDYEETTGLDAINTPFDPEGQITRPDLADTDGDGASDSSEVYAGTDANVASSIFEITPAAMNTNGIVRLSWPSAPGRTYALVRMEHLSDPGTVIAEQAATPPINEIDIDTAPILGAKHYKVRVTRP
jgi:hypothetical protein